MDYLQRQQERRNEPEYKRVADAEKTAMQDAADSLNLTCLKVSQISGGIDVRHTASSWAETFELIDHYLTVARSQNRVVRRNAKLIAARREREENGVFKA